jgi:anti-sigma factor RsiW
VTPRDVACRELVELVTEFLEGALPPDEVLAVEAHLVGCEGCGRYVGQMRATVRALGSVPVDVLPDEAVAALTVAFTERTGPGRGPSR